VVNYKRKEVLLEEYIVYCWNCLGEYDALSAVWCSCNPTHPTKVCPFCLQCFCSAPKDYKDKFFKNAPKELTDDFEMFSQSRGPLGEALVRAKAITADQLLQALKHQKATGRKLGESLVELGFIDQETLAYFLSHQKSVMQLALKDLEVDPMLITSIGADYCYEKAILPVNRELLSQKEILTLAMAQPSDGETIDYVQNVSGCQVVPVQSRKEEILAFLMPFISTKSAESFNSSGQKEITQHGLSVIRKALAKGASDLYIEPLENEVSVQMRIDGILYKTSPMPKDVQSLLIHEMKLLLKLDPFLKDKPQESRVVMKSGEQKYDVIAHSLPTRYGENITLKIINRATFLKSYEQLGLKNDEILLLRSILSANTGLIIISAPVLHGMTTTIYSIMNEMAQEGTRKIVSMEFESVCPVPNVTQVSLGTKNGIDATVTALKALSTIQPEVCVFADALDSQYLAKEAIKLSSSFLVIAGLEARGSIEALQKIVDFGVSPVDVASQTTLILNQRLIRKICPDCRQEGSLSERSLYLMGLTPQEAKGVEKVSQCEGCQNCSKLGYKGRVAIYELFTPTSEFKKMFIKNPKDKNLEKEAIKGGLVTLRQKALSAVKEGITTLEEFQKGNF